MDQARETAMHVLCAVHENGAYANVALAQALRRASLSDVDRRFATELVYGAVKAGDTLDWRIRKYANRPMGKLSPRVRAILRLGIYQLFYLDRVPPSAVCNEAVELAKKYENPGAAKFVNAVLRTAVREPEKATFPEGKGHATELLALTSEHPQWLVKRWIKQFGFAETERLCAFDNTSPVLSLRTNTLKTTRDALMSALTEAGAEVTPSAWAPEGILCTRHGALDDLAPLQDGLCQVQDESSMQVAHVVGARPGEFIIDACSAPGGKTTHLAQLMENRGRIVAADLYEAKVERIAQNAARLGVDIIEAVQQDARTLGAHYSGMADRVLVDAPCSGLGVLRRKPDARWRKTAAEIDAIPALQAEILDGVCEAVKPGGVLVYSTCTIEPAENQHVVDAFLASHAAFVLERTGTFLPTKPRDTDTVQLYPQTDGTDGFFIARMRRKEA